MSSSSAEMVFAVVVAITVRICKPNRHRGKRNPPHGWGVGFRLCTGPLSLTDCSRHAAFYNSDLCWANVQMVFFVSASRLWSAPTWAVTAATPDLQTHHFPSMAAHVSDFTLTRERRLKRGTPAWMADGVCLVSCSAIGGFRRELIREE